MSANREMTDEDVKGLVECEFEDALREYAGGAHLSLKVAFDAREALIHRSCYDDYCGTEEDADAALTAFRVMARRYQRNHA